MILYNDNLTSLPYVSSKVGDRRKNLFPPQHGSILILDHSQLMNAENLLWKKKLQFKELKAD